MASKFSDRMPVILLIIIGLILLVDIINVFALGGPSFFSLIFKTGITGSTPANASYSVNKAMGGEGTPLSVDAGNSPAIYVPTTATPVPVVSYVSAVTPIREDQDQVVYRTFATPTQVQERDPYALIYSGDLSYMHGEDATAVAVDVKEPPLQINYNIAPMIENATILVGNNTISAKKAGSTDVLVNTTYTSPKARFSVSIYDKKSGKKISQEGFGGTDGLLTQDVIMVRDAGSYIVQFSGKFVDAHIEMRIKREGNMV